MHDRHSCGGVDFTSAREAATRCALTLWQLGLDRFGTELKRPDRFSCECAHSAALTQMTLVTGASPGGPLGAELGTEQPSLKSVATSKRARQSLAAMQSGKARGRSSLAMSSDGSSSSLSFDSVRDIEKLQQDVRSCWAGDQDSIWKLRGSASTIKKLVDNVNPNGFDGITRLISSWGVVPFAVLNMAGITENWLKRPSWKGDGTCIWVKMCSGLEPRSSEYPRTENFIIWFEFGYCSFIMVLLIVTALLILTSNFRNRKKKSKHGENLRRMVRSVDFVKSLSTFSTLPSLSLLKVGKYMNLMKRTFTYTADFFEAVYEKEGQRSQFRLCCSLIVWGPFHAMKLIIVAISPFAAIAAVFLKCQILSETVLQNNDWSLSNFVLFFSFLNQLAAMDLSDSVGLAMSAIFGQGSDSAFRIFEQLGIDETIRKQAFQLNREAASSFGVLLLEKFQQEYGKLRGLSLYASVNARDWHKAHLEFDEQKLHDLLNRGRAGPALSHVLEPIQGPDGEPDPPTSRESEPSDSVHAHARAARLWGQIRSHLPNARESDTSIDEALDEAANVAAAAVRDMRHVMKNDGLSGAASMV